MIATLVSPPSLDVDPFDEANLVEPHPVDRVVRETAPVVHLARHDVYAVGRREHVTEIFRDVASFTSAAGTGLRDITREGNWREPSIILEKDPPEHDRARGVMMRVLSPGRIRRLRHDFAVRAEALVDALLERGTFDAATDLGEAFPLGAIPDTVGMAPEGRENILPYSNLNFQAMGPRNERYDRALAEVEARGAADYVAWQIRREALTDDGVGAEIYAAADTGEITHHEAGLLIRTFISAGIDTTALGVGLAFGHLVDHPEVWQALRERPALSKLVFEETLRLTAPSPFIGRTTTREVEVDGHLLPPRAKVMLFVAAANRDPRAWIRPDEFQLDRRTAGHVAFGVGIHQCVGQIIARLEAESVLTALARRVRTVERTAEPVRFESNWLRGWASMPARALPA